MVMLIRNSLKLFCLLLLLFGCNRKETLKKYYESGALMAEAEVVDNKKNGVYIIYYENGDTSSVSYWIGNIKEGLDKSFYEGGNIESIAHYKMGKVEGEVKIFYPNGVLNEQYNKTQGVLDGPAKFYYDNGNLEGEVFYRDEKRVGVETYYYLSGSIHYKRHYVIIGGKEVFTGGIDFNEDGSVKEETIRVEIVANKDTVSIGDNINFLISLHKPRLDRTKMVVGDFDDDFNLIDETSLDTISAEGHKVNYEILAQKKGVNYLRGKMINYEVLDEKRNRTREGHTNFEYAFFVQ
jgi:antitoxin component YwqK of YwqJK toxin-antitoxin module